MSKFILFEFGCEACGNQFDDLVKPDVHTTSCPKCNAEAKRLLSAGHLDYRMGIYSSSFPTAAAKWERIQREKARTDKGSLCDGAPNLKMY